MKRQDKKILDAIAQAIYDKKGFNILALDVREISTMADYCVIAEGTVDRHVKSLYAAVKDRLSQEEAPLYRAEGVKEGDWIVIDCGTIVIHLLVSEMREKYALEELWHKAKIIDVAIDVELSYPSNF
jgi:ribosome-associated protein